MTYEKIGLIGFGKWIKDAYLPFINNLNESKVAHVSTKTQKSLDYAKSIFGNYPRYTLDYKQVLRDKEIDLLILSVPDEFHGEFISDILSIDVDCIFEMPLTENKENSETLISKIKNQNNLIIPNLEMSYLPIVEYLRKIIHEGSYGKLLNAKFKLSANWWPGFGIYASSPWYIDVLNKIFDATPVRVLSKVEKKSKFPTESQGIAFLDYEKFIAEWEFDMESTEGLSVILDLFFEEKAMKVNLMTSEIVSENNKKIEFFEPYHGWPGMNEFLQSVFYSDNKQKIKYIREIESLQKISNALELSMNTNQWVKLL
ncbi:MAG: Gfo/Idh/MocA family oxidoreductase [Chloroflexota bacterium]|nr:Gfo/Idh/MocA family oxidoreductase [Chloroflexota bacterium]